MELSPSGIGLLSEGWKWTRLFDLAIKITDGEHLTPRREASGYYLLSARNVCDGQIDLSDVDYVGEAEYERIRKRCNPEPGDVLISCSGTIGRVAVVPSGLESVLVRSAALVKPDPSRLDGTYAQYALQSSMGQSQMQARVNQGAQPNLFLGHIQELRIPLPPSLAEQRAIAEALSNVDALIAGLDALIAKKRAVKTAAMQQLLMGRQRLPGFSRKWEAVSFGSITRPRKDRTDPSTVKVGAFCVELEHIGSESGRLVGNTTTTGRSSLKATFQPGDILFGKLRSYLRKYWLADRAGVCSTEIWVLPADGTRIIAPYLYQIVTTDHFIEAASTSHGTHMPRSDWKVVKSLEIELPPLDEQGAIAAVLSDMDAEIVALEARRDKTRHIKMGMMQELLTGRTRLVQPTVSVQPVRERSVRPAKRQGHNWPIDEAVVLGCLAERFGSPSWPLARVRRTKLTYLHRRHAGQAPKGFLKQAAGPYNPKARYGGPEQIAKKNGYVREAHNGTYEGFVASESVDKALGYFKTWYGAEALDWLEQFRRLSTDDLGALTTVDYAALELRRAGKDVTIEAVKGVLAADAAWAPKLAQAAFRDEKIEAALQMSAELFGTAVPDDQ